MGLRDRVDRTLDRVRFLVDRQRPYQPLPWVGIRSGSRAEGMETRWAPIESLVDELDVSSALDIGCNAGYFSLSLADRGLSVLAVDFDARFLRLLQHAVSRTGLPVGVLNMRVDPTTCCLLPQVDLTLHLAVWHHDVRTHGIAGATEILRAIWHRTGHALVFETGQAEMAPRYGLPDMGDDPAAFLSEYLRATCPGGDVRWLGRHAARPHDVVVERDLFAVIRT